MRISCPPHIQPCYFGIDFPSADELIAHKSTMRRIAKIIDADSLEYLSLEGMLSCVRRTKTGGLLPCMLFRRLSCKAEIMIPGF